MKSGIATSNDGHIVRITLAGPFSLNLADGQSIYLTSKKSRAILAILSLSEGGKRTRAWLQNCLWGRFEKEDGQSNLRRELSNLTAILRREKIEVLEVLRDEIRLDLSRCHVVRPESGDESAELLEGFDLAGSEEFEEWLRNQRQRIATTRQQTADRQTTIEAATQVSSAPMTALQPAAVTDTRLGVLVRLEAWHNGAVTSELIPQILLQNIVSQLHDSGHCRVTQINSGERVPGSTIFDVTMTLRTTTEGPMTAAFVTGTDFASGNTLLSSMEHFISDGNWMNQLAEIASFSNRTVDQFLHACMTTPVLFGDQHARRSTVFRAVNDMFSLNSDSVQRSKATFDSLDSGVASPALQAWRAYLANLVADPGFRYPIADQNTELRREISRIMNEAPFSGLATSLCVHLSSFALKDMEQAKFLLETAEQSKSKGVMYHDAAAMFHFYAGDLDKARTHAVASVNLGRNLPYQYLFHTSLCMIETMAGKYEQAIAHGLRSIRLEPPEAKLMYPPTVRYLAISYAQLGKTEAARGYFAKLLGDAPLRIESFGDTTKTFPNQKMHELFLQAARKVLPR